MSLSPAPFPFHHRLRVRWVEVDAQQVVFNGHYLMYVDTAVTEYWRTVGLPFPEGLAHFGGEVLVRRNELEYHAPARQDDWLDVAIRCDRMGRTSMTFAWQIRSGGRLLVSGETVYVMTDLATRKPMAEPDAVRTQIEAHARCQPVHVVQLGDWSSLCSGAQAVRRAVFIEEQAIPESEEWDDEDATACHALVSNLAGLPLATARLITHGLAPGHAKIGRMAVIRSSRGVGLGERLLQALIDEARRQRITQLSLHAQTSAQGFYARAGFVPEGDEFDEVGIPHVMMQMALTAP
ncbi:YbgC/FadM family acyl-CoA thioesterase [Aquabacterium sp.]|uniref:YbgC/FadM family acyl-CoA thioesterase n=1 Tax=Aquabacterium sp. TaxID=1872578 RepID=UPI0035AF3B4C